MKYIKTVALHSLFIISIQPIVMGVSIEKESAFAAAITGVTYSAGTGTVGVIAAKTTAVYVATVAGVTAAAPYVAGAVTVYYVTQAGTYVYYQYYPTPEQIAQMEKQKTLAEEQKVQALEAREKQEALMAKAAFKNCLKNNSNSERNAMGVPSACASALHAYAMAASGQQADQDVETFKKYAPQGA